MRVTHSLTYLITESLSVSIDFTDVTLVSDDTYRRLPWYDPDDHDDHSKSVFSVTRRSRSDESHSLTYLLTYLLDVSIDFTDVTLVSDDTYRRLYWCDPDYSDDPDEIYLVMKVI